MRRRHDELIGLEKAILTAALDLRRRGTEEFYGFSIAKHVKGQANARNLTAYGTLYRALARLEHAGLLTSRWEDPAQAVRGHRPARRLYTVTAEGQYALVEALAGSPSKLRQLSARFNPS